MSDIFDRMTKSYMKSAALTQPLMTRRDYGSRSAADFLAEDLMADSTVQINTGYTQGLSGRGPGNAFENLDYYSNVFLEDAELDDIEMNDLLDYDPVDNFRMARFHEGPKGHREWLDWKEENPEAGDEFDRQTEINKDVIKDLAESRSKMASRLAEFYKSSDMTAGRDGYYMSRQNVTEMMDALDVISDNVDADIPLDDWVEDKLTRAHQLLTDLASFLGYGNTGHNPIYHKHATDSYLTDAAKSRGRYSDFDGLDVDLLSGEDELGEVFDDEFGDDGF